MTMQTWQSADTSFEGMRVRSLSQVCQSAARRRADSLRRSAPAASAVMESPATVGGREARPHLCPGASLLSSYEPALVRRPAFKKSKTPSIEYRVIYGSAFVMFFISGACERALRAFGIIRRASAHSESSLLTRTREAANISAAYAFMG